MKKYTKRILAAMLAICLVIGNTSVASAAQDLEVTEVVEMSEVITEVPKAETVEVVETETVEVVEAESVEVIETESAEVVETESAEVVETESVEIPEIEDVEVVEVVDLAYEGEEITIFTQEHFPDPVLWEEVLWSAGKEGAEFLTAEDIEGITYLGHSGDHYYGWLEDLTGIQYLKNLKVIRLDDCYVTDLSPLTACLQLEEIDVRRCEVEVLPDFSHLTNLTELYFVYTCIPNSQVTEDKLPEGVEVTLNRQLPKFEAAIEGATIYRETEDSEHYYAEIKLSHLKEDYSLDLLVEDITNDTPVTIYEKKDAYFSSQSNSYADYTGTGYTGILKLSDLDLIEGEHVWRVSVDYNNRPEKSIIKFVVDPEGVGKTWIVPEEILPAALRDYMLDDYTTARFDDNDDGQYSYAELEKIDSLYMYTDDFQLTNFEFLKYMKSLNVFDIGYQDAFDDVWLETICDYESIKGISSIGFSNMEKVTSLAPLQKISNLSDVTLWSMSGITDVSCLASISSLEFLSIYSMSNMTGLSALKNQPWRYMYIEEGTFSKQEVFDFICTIEEVQVQAGKNKRMVAEHLQMKDTSGVVVTVDDESIAGVAADAPFDIYGFRAGETTAHISYGNSTYDVKVVVTAAAFDYDPAVGEAVPEEDRMSFAGTEGITSARVSRTLVDSEDNIWNITTRTPEKILEKNDYTKYAARILYGRKRVFNVATTVASKALGMYLDEAGTLWSYTQDSHGSSYNFEKKVEIARDIADWQESAYSQASSYSYYDDYLMLLKKDGSLWVYGFSSSYDSQIRGYCINPQIICKLESGGVAAIYPDSYLTEDGKFYRLNYNYNKVQSTLIAQNVTKVWDNSSVALAVDANGVCYTTDGRQNIDGAIKDFLQGSYYNPNWAEMDEYGYIYRTNGDDMHAGYVLTETGKLYRTYDSDGSNGGSLEFLDDGVSKIEKDYYWKGDTAYAYSGVRYDEYLGNGAGRGLYPKDAGDGTQTLYANGVPYLSKVVDWIIGDSCIYAIRIDNTLWKFNEDMLPTQVDMSALNAEPIEQAVHYTEVDIVDLGCGIDQLAITWTPVEGASYYEVYLRKTNGSETVAKVTENSYTFTGLTESTRYYFEIYAMADEETVLGSSYDFYTYTVSPTMEIESIVVERGEDTSSAVITVVVKPESYEVDGQLHLKLDCFNENEYGYVESDYQVDEYFDCTGGGTYQLEISGAPNDFYLSGSVALYVNGSSKIRKSLYFDTYPHMYLTQEDFPDDALWGIVQSGRDKVDAFSITYLRIENPNVKDLTGLDKLVNLKTLYMVGLDKDVIDVTKIPSSVDYLQIISCGLELIPDLSGLPNLTNLWLNSNRIPESEFYESNPALSTFIQNYLGDDFSEWLYWQAQYQLGDPVVYMSNVYYLTTEGNYPFIVEVEKVDTSHKYKLEIYESNSLEQETTQMEMIGSRIHLEIPDMGFYSETEKELEIVIIDLTSSEEIYRGTKTVRFVSGASAEYSKKYLSTSFRSDWFSFKLSQRQYERLINSGWNTLPDFYGDLMTTGKLIDAAGNTIDVEYQVYPRNTYPPEYRNFYYYDEKHCINSYYVDADIPYTDQKHELALGDCLLVMNGYDGSSALYIEGAVEVTDKSIVYGINSDTALFSSNDEYLYVRIGASPMNAHCPELIVTDENGNPVSSEPYEVIFGGSWIWKIHLDEAYRNQENYYYKLTSDYYVGEMDGTIYRNRGYNYAYGIYVDTVNEEIVAYVSEGVADGTNVTVNIYETATDRLIKQQVVAVRNGEIHVDFKLDSSMNTNKYQIEILNGSEELRSKVYMPGGIMGSQGHSVVLSIQGDKIYLEGANAPMGAIIKVFDAKTGSLEATFDIVRGGKFADLDLSGAGLEAGKVYIVNVISENGAGAAKGLFNLKTETKDIRWKLYDVAGEEIPAAAENVYRMDYTAALKNKTVLLETETVGNADAAIKVTSSNTSVVSAALVKGTKNIKLTVKGVGTANITVQALDNKYSETIKIELRDYMPRMDATTLNMNRALTLNAEAAVYPVYNTDITAVEVNTAALTAKEIAADYINYFDVSMTEDGIQVTLLDDSGRVNAKGKPEAIKNGTYRIPIVLTTEEPAETSATGNAVTRRNDIVLSLKLSNTKPTITVKQATKMNLFYTDTAAVYKLTTNTGSIEAVELLVAEGAVPYFDANYNAVDGTFTMIPTDAFKALTSKEQSKALKQTLVIAIGESEISKSVTIGVDKTKPSVDLSAPSHTVYQYAQDGQNIFVGTKLSFSPIDKKTKAVITDATVKLTGYAVTKKGITTYNFEPADPDAILNDDDSYTLSANENGKYTISFIGNASASANIMVQGANWAEPIKTTIKATVAKKAITAKLSTTKVTLNKAYDADQKNIALTGLLPYDNYVLDEENIVVTIPKKAVYTEGDIEITKTDDGLIVSLRDGATLSAGSYKVKVPIKFVFEEGKEYTPAAQTITVTVIDNSLTSKDIKWKTSGKMDAIDRAGSGITATPTISKLNATLYDVAFSEADLAAGFADKLQMNVVDGKVMITLVEGAAVSTKDKFVIHPIVTLATEDGMLYEGIQAPTITVAPTQSTVKVTLSPKQATMYLYSARTHQAEFTYELKGAAGVKIDDVTMTGTLANSFDVLYDKDNDLIKVILKDDSIAAKTYTLKLEFTFVDQTTNAKALSVSTKVVVKK